MQLMGDPADNILGAAERPPFNAWCPDDNPSFRDFLNLIAEILVAEYLQYQQANDQEEQRPMISITSGSTSQGIVGAGKESGHESRDLCPVQHRSAEPQQHR